MMRPLTFWCAIVTTAGLPGLLSAQQSSLLRDVAPMQVVIDHVHAQMTDAAADSLWRRVVVHLRAAGVPVTEKKNPVTLGSFLFAPLYAFDKPTFLVSLNMVPDGCAFVVNFSVRMSVPITGYAEKVSVAAYASRSYVYRTTWTDHTPVLNYVDDFIEVWRTANQR